MKYFGVISAFSAILAAKGSPTDSVDRTNFVSEQLFLVDNLIEAHKSASLGEIKATFMESIKISDRTDIVKGKPAPNDLNHIVVIAVKHSNTDKLKATLSDISNPVSPFYGNHLSMDEVSALSSNPTSFEEIRKYLDLQGIKVIKTSSNNQYITAEAPISKWEEVFGNEFYLFKQTDLADVHLVRAEEYSLPDNLVPHVEAILNIVQFPGRDVFKNSAHSHVVATESETDNLVTPALLNELYAIRSNQGHINASQAVVEVSDQALSSNDVAKFQKDFNLPADTVSNIGGHVEAQCAAEASCARSNLGVEYLMAVSQTTPTTYMYWNGTDFWLDWITSVAEMTDPPLVISISYLQYEHEVSQSYANLFNIEAMKLSLAGVTLVVAAGDDGAAGPDARRDPLRCGYFPQFPATSPYVTSVGATMGPESGRSEVACQSNKGGAITSGGGFSTLFKVPDYQATSMSQHCTQYCSSVPSVSPSASPTQPTIAPSLSPTSVSSSPSQVPTPTPSATPTASPSSEPSALPSASPSAAPSSTPTVTPSSEPSASPSAAPSSTPSVEPSVTPSAIPSSSPSSVPSEGPSALPSVAPSAGPSVNPSAAPSASPSAEPSAAPSAVPSVTPSVEPTASPSSAPSAIPSVEPSASPSATPSSSPSSEPTVSPSSTPSVTPSVSPSAEPSVVPSVTPSVEPTASPSAEPSSEPSATPSSAPSAEPSASPSATPSMTPSSEPSASPSAAPSITPSAEPSVTPSAIPSSSPSVEPTVAPSAVPSVAPSAAPTVIPSAAPSASPSAEPSAAPSAVPSAAPSVEPTASPSALPSATPSAQPSESPSVTPSSAPSAEPSAGPSVTPSSTPSAEPTVSPSATPSATPSVTPSATPSAEPTSSPSATPSVVPSAEPTVSPSSTPSVTPSITPSAVPSAVPSISPSAEPSVSPSATPSATPSVTPSAMPSAEPSASPSATPSTTPSAEPTVSPSSTPSVTPSVSPSAEPSVVPSISPSAEPSVSPSAAPTTSTEPSVNPTATPSATPSVQPSTCPSITPSIVPSAVPSVSPSSAPSAIPSASPSSAPSAAPSVIPSSAPSVVPSASPSSAPSAAPSVIPSSAPSVVPSVSPSSAPSVVPSASPSSAPSVVPSVSPSVVPSATPSASPSAVPSVSPSTTPSAGPTVTPSVLSSTCPSAVPSVAPTAAPTATPSTTPSAVPSGCPSVTPSVTPSVAGSPTPTMTPSVAPSKTRRPSSTMTPTTSFRPSYRTSLPTARNPTTVPTYTMSPSTVAPSAAPSRSLKPTANTASPTMSDNKVTWRSVTVSGSVNLAGSAMTDDGSMVIMTLNSNSIRKSTDYGYSFYKVDDGGSWWNGARTAFGGLGCSADLQYCYTVEKGGNLARKSSDYGETWDAIDLSLVALQASPLTGGSSVAASQSGQNVILMGRFMIISFNYGATFSKLLPPSGSETQTYSHSSSAASASTSLSADKSDRVYYNEWASGASKLYRTLNWGGVWTQLTIPDATYRYLQVSFDYSGVHGFATVYKNDDTNFLSIYSTNRGASWSVPQADGGDIAFGYRFCQDQATGQYITLGGRATDKLYSSNDYGATFTSNPWSAGTGGPWYLTFACSFDASVVTGYSSTIIYGNRGLYSTRRLNSVNDTVTTGTTGSSRNNNDVRAAVGSAKIATNTQTVQAVDTTTACTVRKNEFACVGRGYPDLAVLGHNYLMVSGNKTMAVSGTSASTPVVAGMISLVNARRLKAGKSSLGWLNPALYANYAKFANDITSGENNCAAGGEVCCGTGYKAGVGWDPVTGLGSVNFTAFSDVLFRLGDRPYVPTRAPSPGPGEPTMNPALTPTFEPSFPPYTAPAKLDGWFTVKYFEGDNCNSTLLQATASATNDCISEYNSTGSLVGSRKYTCGDYENAYITRYTDGTCSRQSFVASETYYLGCNPQVRIKDNSGNADRRSVSLSCSSNPAPTFKPTRKPSQTPSFRPTRMPTAKPSFKPSSEVSEAPIGQRRLSVGTATESELTAEQKKTKHILQNNFKNMESDESSSSIYTENGLLLDVVPSNGLQYAVEMAFGQDENLCSDGVVDPQQVSIRLDDHCFDMSAAAANTSAKFRFPEVRLYNGENCEALREVQVLSGNCSTSGVVWFGYSAPTAAPTAMPSVSFTPTAVPSEQSMPKVVADASVQLSGLATPTLNRKAKSAVVASTCSAMELTASSCVFSQVAFTPVGATHTAVVVVTVTIELIDYPEFEDTDSLYDSVNALLEDSFTNGNFTQLLVENAAVYGAPELTGLGVEVVTLGQAFVQQPPSHAPTQKPADDLTTGEFAGVVIGVVLCGLFLIACVFFAMKRHSPSMSRETNGGGSEAAEMVAAKPLEQKV